MIIWKVIDMDAFTWQDILLCVIIIIFLVRFSYRMGYNDGKNKEQFINGQKELEKSGNFFWDRGVRIPYPPYIKQVKEKCPTCDKR